MGKHDDHLDKDQTLYAATQIYDLLERSCPGCAMGVVSMLISMLAVNYTKEEAKHGRIFDHDDWMTYIIDAARAATNKFDRRNTTTNN